MTRFGYGFLGELAKGPVDDPFSLLRPFSFRRQACNDEDNAARALGGRTDKTVSCLLRMARFQAISADPEFEQRVAVETVLRCATVIGEFELAEIAVVFGKFGDQARGEKTEIFHRHALVGIGPTACVGEG